MQTVIAFSPYITAMYAGVAGLVYMALSVMVIKARIGNKVIIGDGGSDAVLHHMRAHANFIEYVPIVLLMLLIAELLGAHYILLHGCGMSLLIGRFLHAYSLTNHELRSAASGERVIKFRQRGMVLTFIPLIVLSVTCILL